ncbi:MULTISPECIES: hypothetical protein [Pantoea]|jgi:hypothetical protein|uniref:hypothetical protein n=1 Tax=Pantoea TaxID=53335 RepID=UPI000EA38716|nr:MULTISPECIES: hypothetical protein [Pantoea]MBZ6385505.1 hypothetical protein [Pantoea piersonii]MBZ6398951.1 hypothetical protein [Pantoea piersonii]MBZ6407551.1 hypothetical protein [Pantoea piersonii]MBZ6425498.1 hypothetical protein [Pantoea piersonii]NYB00978.1 hypothetical protein [Pantoea piersonii]
MTQVIQLVIEPPKLRQARNLTLAIMNLAQKGTLTPEQYQARLEAVGILAQEAHDAIMDAGVGKIGGENDPLSWRTNNT